jgi:hypothetical protein
VDGEVLRHIVVFASQPRRVDGVAPKTMQPMFVHGAGRAVRFGGCLIASSKRDVERVNTPRIPVRSQSNLCDDCTRQRDVSIAVAARTEKIEHWII